MPAKKSKEGKKDIVIPVMGLTGAGKSTFINTLLKEPLMKVGYTLSSCTSELGFGYIETIHGYPKLENYRIVIVDTPGFDDTYKGDEEILRSIAIWLKQSYEKKAILGGVIYLHDVSSDRFSATARRNLAMFQRLCGLDALPKVVLGTTKWSRVPSSFAENYQTELKDIHWKSLIAKGSQVQKFSDTYESAWSFIETIIRKYEQKGLLETPLQIQTELGKDRKIIQDTEASKVLRCGQRDVVILIAGPSGAGKSNFINALLGKERMAVGLNMTSCTVKVDSEIIDHIPGHPGHRLVIVDTPGFNDTNLVDTKILQQIAEWLNLRCKDGMILGGVIYLQEICQDRFSSLTKSDLTMLRASFGDSNETLGRVVLATTKWGRVSAEEGGKREKELKEAYFKSLIDRGSEMRRFEDSAESAWSIVNVVLDQVADDPSFDIGPRLAKLRGHLNHNSGDKGANEFFSLVKALFALFGRVNGHV